ncbi:hypothetical protein Pcac1_g15098 [Phytophthora cactorum]|uniref:Uncharacterized protein n=1 Tax=Phytophthora cactorum TaxID=29920 RepID=A0A8T0Z4B6_9STRA|nr:hypothetical protein Pcac1_g15098 [Phytophthora cactorum]KAG2856940.1 hypothetical protein PC113_g11130 [Phytophthora cactorum]KAG2978908.1 hypothetical protein PC118_g12027 [Phytophthora cactorum]KAG3054004.1 hypothetical protein PC122_g22168 [Phytophthora cactorum]
MAKPPLRIKFRRIINTVSSAARLSADGAEILRIKAKLAIPGRNRSQDLQKQELLELRVEVSRLQERVDELRSSARVVYSEKDYTSRAKKVPGTLTGCAGDVLLDAWRGLAKKQKILGRDAENENEYLRELSSSPNRVGCSLQLTSSLVL